MNWWKAKKYYLSCILFIGFLNSCTSGFDDVNKSIRPAQSSLGNFLRIDSTSIKTSTVLYDYTPSNNSYRALIGDYNDPIFGKINTNTYFQLIPTLKISGPNIKFDSVSLILDVQASNFTEYAIGDTSQAQNFKVFRVEQNFYNTFTVDGIYFNSKTFSVASDELASFSIKNKNLLINGTSKSITIPLKASFGQEIIDNYETYLNSKQEFVNNVKGIYIQSLNNTAIWGVLSGKIRIYYHDFFANNDIKTPFALDIAIGGNNGDKIRNLNVDRTGTPLQNIATAPLETQTCYVQASTGVGTKVQFPFLKDFEKNLGNKKVLVNRAELIIKPDMSTSGSNLGFPLQIFAYLLDENGNVKNTKEQPFVLSEPDADRVPVTKHNFENNAYTIPITAYIQSILDEKRSVDESLLISADTRIYKIDGIDRIFALSELNGMVFYNKPNTPYNIKLKLFYTVY